MEYFKHKIDKTFYVDELITVHYFRYCKDFSVEGERHDFYEFVYVDSGSVTIVDGGTDYVLKAGEAFVHKRGVFHSIKTNQTLSNIFISTFDGKNIDTLDIFEKIIQISHRTKEIVSKIISVADQTFEGELDIVEQSKMELKENSDESNLHLISILIEQLLLALDTKPLQQMNNDKNSISKNIENFLRCKLTTTLTLSEISKKLGYSISHLKKQFSKDHNCGILQFHIKLKVERAKEAIAENDMNLSQISDMLDFASPQYFSASFKKVTNMTPSQYAKSIKLTNLL